MSDRPEVAMKRPPVESGQRSPGRNRPLPRPQRTKGQSSHGPLLQGLVEKIRFRTHIIRISTSATSPVVLADEAPGGVAGASGSGSAATVPPPLGAPAPLAGTRRTALRGSRGQSGQT